MFSHRREASTGNQDAFRGHRAVPRFPVEPPRTRLPSDQIEGIFKHRIFPAYRDGLARSTSNRQPMALFIIGQPGSGKSSVEGPLLTNLGYPKLSSLDGDDLYVYHPSYESFAGKDDIHATQACDPDVDQWSGMLFNHAVYSRASFVLHFSPCPGVDERMEALKRQGYRVEVAFVAVNDNISRQGIVDRYFAARSEKGYGRWVDLEVHDNLYPAVPRLAGLVNQKKCADAAYVVVRGGEIVHRQHIKSDGNWSYTPRGIATVINDVRERKWTPGQAKDFLDRQERIGDWAGRTRSPLPDLPDKVYEIGIHANPMIKSAFTPSIQIPATVRTSVAARIRPSGSSGIVPQSNPYNYEYAAPRIPDQQRKQHTRLV
ncbi:zeta toxin family protein [Streptomyces sp. NBC_00271]|uniref:zeta toxin family protein n=1 Tax=Streptomyces sp. NBC_00271 TaxID=2975697 RepID=UPI002E293CA3|nr:zeta toxin family protein [Streptomyces sp. NBC_00271]